MGRAQSTGIDDLRWNDSALASGMESSIDIVSAFQCYGQYIAGQIDEATRSEIVKRSCP